MPEGPIEQSPATLKALSSPLRRRILHHLGVHGPGNSTTIAEAVGESSGTTSYHLRRLAEAGLIAEAPELAKGRERWWRTVRADRRMPDLATLSDEDRMAAEALLRARFEEDLDLLAAAFSQGGDREGWAQGSRGGGHMTLEEMREFHEEYVKLLQRFTHGPEDAPPGARPVIVRWFAAPDPRVPRRGEESNGP
ncbi:ArsR/SmtB family transcription factor [Glycomyces albidus]|jgi:DNA-binding transcriptional ArsR family regulator|uniref:Helix-turn-helix domain-containing protein n=1 Tax=Glycomyces albidus TaxID=2656774 RepID=A0A6L5GES8_9ACTN|nr:winged helix-turn-helix domain-containing protein [Glycomyces albidus]MQM28081.1 helix-turn-helix domain-containing protein [Glycomyces albidus]